ncbi:MAG: 5'/3'-nucleotidase SurE [Vicingaceae bacterium]
MNNSKPLILVTNDDGFSAPGIRALVEAVKNLGEIVVVAPDSPQSGMGHAITVSATIHLNTMEIDGIRGYKCSGTPVDCVKIAVNKILDRKPDLIVSGINHGSNSSINVIYSGTMSAAVEGAIENIPAIGFSLCSHSIDADFKAAIEVAREITEKTLVTGMPSNSCLNVNIPNVGSGLIEGIKVCRQARAVWEEEFDERVDPQGRTYYWLTGKFINHDRGEDTDEWALKNNFVSVVPVECDFTDYASIDHFKTLER